jgi:hypothetical protein
MELKNKINSKFYFKFSVQRRRQIRSKIVGHGQNNNHCRIEWRL